MDHKFKKAWLPKEPKAVKLHSSTACPVVDLLITTPVPISGTQLLGGRRRLNDLKADSKPVLGFPAAYMVQT